MNPCCDYSVGRVEPLDDGSIRSFLDTLDERSRRYLSVATAPIPPTPTNGTPLGARADQAAFVALSTDGTVMGTAEWRRTRHDGELARLSGVVAAGCRRRGVATALLRALALDAVEVGVAAWFMTTLSANRPALGLMRSLSPGAYLSREGVLTTVLAPLHPLLPVEGTAT